jgi:ABC-type transporter Mla subunit MlaD
MANDRNAFKAGLFIVISVLLIFVLTFMIKGLGRFTDPTIIRTAKFTLTDNIGGLRIGDDVRVGGLKVGVVKSVDLQTQPSGSPEIRVYFTIPTRIKVHKDAHVEIESTVTGTSDLNIDNLGEAALAPSGEPLVGSPSALSTLLASAQQIMPEVRDTVHDVHTQTMPRVNNTIDHFSDTATNATDLIKALRAKLDPIIDRYYALTDTGKGALANIRDLFGDTKTDFRGTMHNLNQATATVNQKLPDIMNQIDTALQKSQGTIDNVNSTLADVKQTVANTRDITATGRSILTDNHSKIDGMIASLKATGDNLKNASAEIRRSPWRLLYKPGPGEVANLNLYDSARQFADGANAMNDAATALRDALKDPNSDQKKIHDLQDQLDKSFQNFNDVETQLWKNVKE